MLPGVPLRPRGDVMRTVGPAFAVTSVPVVVVRAPDAGPKPACMTNTTRLRYINIHTSGVDD
jgi:hypothetical protein